MKKRILMLSAVAVLAVALSGCNNPFKSSGLSVDKESEKLVEQIDKAGLLDSAAEDTLVDAAVAADDFANALTKSTDEDNVTIASITKTDTGAVEGEVASSSDGVGTQSSDTVNEAQHAVNKVVLKKNVTDSASKASAVIENDYNGEASTIDAFYDGSVLYFTTDGGDSSSEPQKIKETMTYDDFASVVNGYSLSVYSADIQKASCTTAKDGSKAYLIEYDPVKIESTMKSNLEASGNAMSEDEDMTVNYANISANIDKDGYLTSYSFVINANITNENGNMPYSYSIACKINDIGTTVLDEISDTDKQSYTDAADLTSDTQEDTTQSEGAGELGTEIVTDEADSATDTTEATTVAQ